MHETGNKQFRPINREWIGLILYRMKQRRRIEDTYFCTISGTVDTIQRNREDDQQKKN